jgi:hypothetical protein
VEPITTDRLRSYFERLGKRFEGGGVLYLLGGSAMALLGSPRTTVDLDYTLGSETESQEQLEAAIAELAEEMHLDAESDIIPSEFREYMDELRRRWREATG